MSFERNFRRGSLLQKRAVHATQLLYITRPMGRHNCNHYTASYYFLITFYYLLLPIRTHVVDRIGSDRTDQGHNAKSNLGVPPIPLSTDTSCNVIAGDRLGRLACITGIGTVVSDDAALNCMRCLGDRYVRLCVNCFRPAWNASISFLFCRL